MRRSVIVDVALRMVMLSAVVLSLYLLGAGHNQPGGGFVGGLVAGVAVALLYVAGGLDQVREFLPARPWTILATGLVVAAGSAIVPLLAGGAVLEQTYWDINVPLVGDVKLATALLFDAGVFAVVLGMVPMAFEALGEQDPPPGEADV